MEQDVPVAKVVSEAEVASGELSCTSLPEVNATRR